MVASAPCSWSEYARPSGVPLAASSHTHTLEPSANPGVSEFGLGNGALRGLLSQTGLIFVTNPGVLGGSGHCGLLTDPG